MKYHLASWEQLDDSRYIKTVCGKTLLGSKSFVYDRIGFNEHFAKKFECKQCRKKI